MKKSLFILILVLLTILISSGCSRRGGAGSAGRSTSRLSDLSDGGNTVTNAQNESRRQLEFTFKYRGRQLTLKIDVRDQDIDRAQEAHDRVRSMTTVDMGIEQETADYSTRIEEAIRKGDSDEARRLMAELDGKGSFYSREWKAYHPILQSVSASFITGLSAAFSNILRSHAIPFNEMPAVMTVFIQALPYGGQNGAAAPLIMLVSGQGTCAARSYTLMLLLRSAGVDCVMAGSQDYNHMVLAVALPASGLYLEYRNKRYYLLETSAPGWLPGRMEKKWSDLSSWQILDI